MKVMGRWQVQRWRVSDMERYVVKLIVAMLFNVALVEAVKGLMKLIFHWGLGRWNLDVVVALGNVFKGRRRWKVMHLCYMLSR